VRRLLHALGESEEQQTRRLHWSRFRRQHQARAQRFHRLRRARQAPAVSADPPAPLPLLGIPVLTDEHWQQLRPLLPPQTGRPAVDHRLVVEAMLWVARSGSSWRELPERFGPWSTVSSRYQRWLKEGLWQRILQVLLPQEALPCSPSP
jgi:Putative transposase of IS4/5 family (DUF4096)